jgi:hypothetical protein
MQLMRVHETTDADARRAGHEVIASGRRKLGYSCGSRCGHSPRGGRREGPVAVPPGVGRGLTPLTFDRAAINRWSRRTQRSADQISYH